MESVSIGSTGGIGGIGGAAALAQTQQKQSPIAIPKEEGKSPIELPKLAESGSLGTRLNAWA